MNVGGLSPPLPVPQSSLSSASYFFGNPLVFTVKMLELYPKIDPSGFYENRVF